MLRCVTCLFFLLCAVAVADELPCEQIPVSFGETAPPTHNIDFTKELKRISLTLGAVIVLMIATIYLLRRLASQRSIRYNKQSKIQILERRGVSPKTTLYLLEIDGKKVFFAESTHGLTSMAWNEKSSKDFKTLLEEEKAEI